MGNFHSVPTGKHAFELGEGPVWSPENQKLSIVDIFQRRVHLYELKETELIEQGGFETEGDIGAALPLANGEFVLCENQGIFLRENSGSRHRICEMPVTGSNFRCNDAKIGPDGNLWVGIMDYDATEGNGSLWRISRSGDAQQLLAGLTIPNGMDWWDDQFWFVDGPAEVITQYRWSNSGIEKTGQVFSTNGTPDGLVIDSNGELWLALWGEGRVDHLNSVGEVVDSISVASPHSTSLCFAGNDLKTLVMTSARFAMTQEALDANPNSGDLFTLRAPVSGRKANTRFS